LRLLSKTVGDPGQDSRARHWSTRSLQCGMPRRTTTLRKRKSVCVFLPRKNQKGATNCPSHAGQQLLKRRRHDVQLYGWGVGRMRIFLGECCPAVGQPAHAPRHSPYLRPAAIHANRQKVFNVMVDLRTESLTMGAGVNSSGPWKVQRENWPERRWARFR